MPNPGAGNGLNGLAKGLFGSFQSAVQDGASTGEVWQRLRSDAAAWKLAATGETGSVDDAGLEDLGRQILSENGVGIQQVNQGRSLAGAWAAAKANLQAAAESEQITAGMIFKPPWANTLDSSVPDRYRIRVQISGTGIDDEELSKWSSYELEAPLTTVGDALAQIDAKVKSDKYLQLLAGGDGPSVTDYEIEQL